jgi:hypothetical protein
MSGKTGPKTEVGLQTVSRNLDPTAWTQNPEAVHAIEVAKRLRNTKHGLYASVPIICKSHACPYKESCMLYQMDLAPHGEKCPVEIAAIEDLFYRYCEDLKIDPGKSSNTVDLVMVKELVDLDISLLRCDNKMAVDADFIIQNVVSVTEDGEPITKSELHPVAEYKEKLLNRKHKILQLLNSTRKDKEGTKITIGLDPSERAAQMLKVQQDMKILEQDEEEAERRYWERMSKGNNVVIDVEPIGLDEQEE